MIFNPELETYTSKLRSFFSSFFKARGVDAYYQTASNEAKYPHIVYEFRHIGSFDDSGKGRRYSMEINAYNEKSEIILDKLLDFLEKEISGLYLNTAELFITAKMAYGRIDIEEDNPLKRKRVTFEINYWYKGE